MISDLEVTASNHLIDLEFTSEFELIELVIQTSSEGALADQSATAPHDVMGTTDDDALMGTTSDDEIRGASGSDYIEAKQGHDLIYAGDQGDTIYAGGGDDVVYSGRGNDYVHLGRGNDYFIDGNHWGASVVIGGAGDDEIHGRGGDDIIDAGIGDDIVDGGDGNDLIDAGSGENIVTGGAGSDQFVFDTSSGTTTITDFRTNEDQINLSELLDGYVNYTVQLGDREFHFTSSDGDGLISSVDLDIQQAGEDVVVTISTGSHLTADPRNYIIVQNIRIEELSETDFIL